MRDAHANEALQRQRQKAELQRATAAAEEKQQELLRLGKKLELAELAARQKQAGEETAAIEKAKGILSEGVKVFLQTASRTELQSEAKLQDKWSSGAAREFGRGAQGHAARRKMQEAAVASRKKAREIRKERAAERERALAQKRRQKLDELGLGLDGGGVSKEREQQAQKAADLANGIMRTKLPTGEILIKYNVDTEDQMARRREMGRTKFPLKVSAIMRELPAGMSVDVLERGCYYSAFGLAAVSDLIIITVPRS